MRSWSAGTSGAEARFSPKVLPVTVMALPSRMPALSRCFKSMVVPPMRCRSTMVPLPRGAKFAYTGVRRQMACTSRRVKSTPASFATARRWMTPLVEPPTAAMALMALVKAVFVRMSRGRRLRSSRSFTASPTRRHSARFASSMAGMLELLGSIRPSASLAMPQVLKEAAMPQPPAPGQAWRIISSDSSRVISPALAAAWESYESRMVMARPL